jgi:hypothetical protein
VYERSYRTEVERRLSAIAQLKVGELTQWRKERLADAKLLFRNEAFATLARRCLETPDDVDVRRPFLEWLERFQEYGQYEGVFLLGTAHK